MQKPIKYEKSPDLCWAGILQDTTKYQKLKTTKTNTHFNMGLQLVHTLFCQKSQLVRGVREVSAY